MPKLNKSQGKWLEAVYNRAFRESNDNNFSLRFAAKIYQATRLNPKFESADGSVVGLAALPSGVEGIDPFNAEAALSFAVERDLGQYIQSEGDVNSFTQTDIQQIEVIEDELDAELFGNDDTFTGIDSPENRFKKAMKTDNTDALGQVIDEMVVARTGQRNKVISNA